VTGSVGMSFTVPALSAGQSWVARVPADPIALKNAGQLTFTTQLVNPAGLNDRVPSNNRKASVLTTPSP
jgi:hypothetical protein